MYKVEVYHPIEIYLFGSYAWGHPTDDSDLSLDAAVLSPFATEFCYPIDDEIVVERKVVLDAISRAKKILMFVEKKYRRLYK